MMAWLLILYVYKTRWQYRAKGIVYNINRISYFISILEQCSRLGGLWPLKESDRKGGESLKIPRDNLGGRIAGGGGGSLSFTLLH